MALEKRVVPERGRGQHEADRCVGAERLAAQMRRLKSELSLRGDKKGCPKGQPFFVVWGGGVFLLGEDCIGFFRNKSSVYIRQHSYCVLLDDMQLINSTKPRNA
jgi:hypothetical protein